jgi:hypothetical protein
MPAAAKAKKAQIGALSTESRSCVVTDTAPRTTTATSSNLKVPR